MIELDCCKCILSLVNGAINERVSIKEDYLTIDWDRVYALANKNGLIPLLYDAVLPLSANNKKLEELISQWKNTTMHSMLSECEKYRELRQILKRAKELNVTCILLKGCVLADLYPKYMSRVSCDTDILVYMQDKAKAIKIFEDLGYHKNEKASKDLVYVYKSDSNKNIVELHFSLWEDYIGTKIDLIDKMNLTNEETLIKINACGIEVTTLGYQEHLVFQMFHIIKHFSLQGISIRYLVDVALYVHRYEEYINFSEFWRKMERLGYDKFCENFFNICIQYLEMSPNILKGRKIRVAEGSEAFLMDLINVGTIFNDKNAGWQLLGIMTPYFIGASNVPKSRFMRYLKVLFPASRDLPTEFEYARRHKILLPIAWTHKWGSFFLKWRMHKEDWYTAKEKLIVAEHRLSLMRSLGLIDGGKSE